MKRSVHDELNHKSLCQGENLVHDRRNLTCFYSHRGLGGDRRANEIFGADTYFTIRPLKIEVLHPDPHPVILIHEVVSDEESNGLIDQVWQLTRFFFALPLMKISAVVEFGSF